ncbi:MAG TPA: NADH:flavin oxidoreductase/NADH oxidase [Bacteroidota bacterium]|nr:NADH:flavin oxidoreductase/NADH oxidase [Bacteroidota bacterium]
MATTSETTLLSPLAIRGLTLPNRIAVSPMCQYSSTEGLANDWHLVHLGSRAVGGAGTVFVEATAVTREGRISPGDMGLWSDAHIEPLARIARFIGDNGTVPGIQLAHAGRKASTLAPFEGTGPLKTREQGAWETVAPSPIPFDEGYPPPRMLTAREIESVVDSFALAAARAVHAGFRVIELHMAHGYLIHEFLSPFSNARTDSYGGLPENRMRLAVEVATRVRGVIPADMPLFTRVSATDWAEGGWDLEQTVVLARRLKEAGVDLVDCSSGGLLPRAVVPAAPGYQVPFASAVRERAGILTGAVGLITDVAQANEIIASGKADIVLLARQMLRDPYWGLKARHEIEGEIRWPKQYERAKLRK